MTTKGGAVMMDTAFLGVAMVGSIILIALVCGARDGIQVIREALENHPQAEAGMALAEPQAAAPCRTGADLGAKAHPPPTWTPVPPA